MKKRKGMVWLLLTSLLLSGCAQQPQQDAGEESSGNSMTVEEMSLDTSSDEDAAEPVTEQSSIEEDLETSAEGNGILIVYFTRLDNTEADLDTIVQGGGPYGEIGNSYAEADLDAISSASITVRDGEAEGNTQVIAEMIQKGTGGELFSIRTAVSYPVEYGELIDVGGAERNESARPELVNQVENIDDYDVIFLGFPNWWHDMPMALYSFLESYDLSGKRIIPFATSAGSGFDDAVASIREVQPQAQVEENGLHIPMRQVAGADSQVQEWLIELGMANGVN